MPMVKAKGAKGFRASIADGAVVVSIRTGEGEEHFALPADQIPRIMAQLAAAHARAAQKSGRPRSAIVAPTSTITPNRTKKTIMLTLCPTKSLEIPFSVTPDHARKIASSLTEAAAGFQGDAAPTAS